MTDIDVEEFIRKSRKKLEQAHYCDELENVWDRIKASITQKVFELDAQTQFEERELLLQGYDELREFFEARYSWLFSDTGDYYIKLMQKEIEGDD